MKARTLIIITGLIMAVLLAFSPKLFVQKMAFSSTFYTLTLLPEALGYYQHWNEIVDGLLLGALPIETYYNHGAKIVEECVNKSRPLGKVYSIVNEFELNGEGLVFLSPVSPAYWWRE
jgi:hypothetical protein